MKIVHTIVSEEVIVAFMAFITVSLALFWSVREIFRLKKGKAKGKVRTHDENFGSLIGVMISTIAVCGVVKHYFF